MNKQRQTVPPEQRYTIQQFQDDFPDTDTCLEHIAMQKWPEGRTKCASDTCKGKVRKHHRVSGRTAYACDSCGNHIYPLAGTIFEKSSTDLRLWFYAIYLMGSTRCGISAKQLQRETGVTYKTAWRMFKQIRSLMSESGTVEGAAVEMDETFMGGTRKYSAGRRMRGDKKLTPVAGIVQRKGRVIARAVADTKSKTLLGMVKECVLPSSMIFTDEAKMYDGIKHMAKGYAHRRIKHTAKVYVKGDIHTNTIEGFWSLVKRGIGGVYHAVSEKYLQSYLDEYSFRYNRRDFKGPMFSSILSKVYEKAEQPSSVSAENLAGKSLPVPVS